MKNLFIKISLLLIFQASSLFAAELNDLLNNINIGKFSPEEQSYIHQQLNDIKTKKKDVITVADLMYHHGYLELAKTLDDYYLKSETYAPFFYAEEIAQKWKNRGDHSSFLHFIIKNPDDASTYLEELIDNGQTDDAGNFLAILIAYWTQQNTVDDMFLEKIMLLTRKSYNIKICQKFQNEHNKKDSISLSNTTICNYHLNQSYLPLKPNQEFDTIINTILSKIYCAPEFLDAFHEITQNKITQIIKQQLYEMILSDDLVFKIIHVVAWRAKSDPYYRIELNYKENLTIGGFYSPHLNLVSINNNLTNLLKFKIVLIHELSHQLMDVLYHNDSNPYTSSYYNNNYDNYQNSIRDLKKNLKALLNQYKNENTIDPKVNLGIQSLRAVPIKYSSKDHDREFVVRYPEILVQKTMHYPEIQTLYQPLESFWKSTIEPDIDTYLRNHSKDNFISSKADLKLLLINSTPENSYSNQK